MHCCLALRPRMAPTGAISVPMMQKVRSKPATDTASAATASWFVGARAGVGGGDGCGLCAGNREWANGGPETTVGTGAGTAGAGTRPVGLDVAGGGASGAAAG